MFGIFKEKIKPVNFLFYDIQTVIIFVVLTSVGVTRVDCNKV